MCFCVFLLLLKLLPPHSQKVHFYQFFLLFCFKSPTLYKDSQIQSLECLSVLCTLRAPPRPPFNQAWPLQSPRHLDSGPGVGWGAGPGHQTLVHSLQAAPARNGGLPSPLHLLAPVPPPPHCKSMYLMRASLNSEVVAPGAPPSLQAPDPSCASHPPPHLREGYFNLNNFLK